jgi:hypothetical protein
MIEILVGFVLGALAMLPAVLAQHHQAGVNEQGWLLEAARTEKAGEKIDGLYLKLGARTYEERTNIEALLNRPEPEPEERGRWLYSDDGLVQTFVPEVG